MCRPLPQLQSLRNNGTGRPPAHPGGERPTHGHGTCSPAALAQFDGICTHTVTIQQLCDQMQCGCTGVGHTHPICPECGGQPQLVDHACGCNVPSPAVQHPDPNPVGDVAPLRPRRHQCRGRRPTLATVRFLRERAKQPKCLLCPRGAGCQRWGCMGVWAAGASNVMPHRSCARTMSVRMI